jgi:very-short-patch-repair endonuclease
MTKRSNKSPEEPTWQTSGQLWEKLKPLARQKRSEPTPAENWLWQRLRNRQVANAKFCRQYSIDKFIVDFYCLQAKLVIEVDGPIHEYSVEEDAIRQEFLESLGNKVLRFTNSEILTAPEQVIQRISIALHKAKSITGSSSPVGEGVRG